MRLTNTFTTQSITLRFTFFWIAFLLTGTVAAQDRGGDQARVSPDAAVTQTIGTTEVHVTYGRPQVGGRDIFGSLVPFQQVWRTGANEASAIVFSDDVLIEGHEVEAGTYSLYTIPGEEEWTIIINERLTWGTQYDEAYDVLRTTVEPEQAQHMEQFMIYFEEIDAESGTLVLHWDDIRVPVGISVAGR